MSLDGIVAGLRESHQWERPVSLGHWLLQTWPAQERRKFSLNQSAVKPGLLLSAGRAPDFVALHPVLSFPLAGLIPQVRTRSGKAVPKKVEDPGCPLSSKGTVLLVTNLSSESFLCNSL